MENNLSISTQAFVWGLGGICQTQRIPFAPELVLRQIPPPYNLLSLQRAAQGLGINSSFRAVALADVGKLVMPCLAVLKPATNNSPSPSQGEGKGEGEAQVSLALVIKIDNRQIVFFEPGDPNAKLQA